MGECHAGCAFDAIHTFGLEHAVELAEGRAHDSRALAEAREALARCDQGVFVDVEPDQETVRPGAFEDCRCVAGAAECPIEDGGSRVQPQVGKDFVQQDGRVSIPADHESGAPPARPLARWAME